MKWSENAWREAEHIYNKILKLPFVVELSAGSLSRERFDFYLQQDAVYLENYSRVLAHIASRISSKRHSEAFLRFALDGVAVEKALHQSFIGNDAGNVHPTPTCLLYMNFALSKMLGPVEVEAAALLPCFWIYQRVGEEIYGKSGLKNPYMQWIDTYADKSFADATQRAIEICNELADAATPAIRKSMTEAFLYASRMEWMFWDSAYNLEQWKI